MLEQLFGSKTRFKLLRLFMCNPNRSFYVREITRKIDEQINSVRRELANLLSVGVIRSDSTSNRLYYEVSQDYEHYGSFSSIFNGNKSKSVTSKKQSKPPTDNAKTVKGTASTVGEDERALGNIDLVILSGVFTRDPQAPVDLLIVGNVTPASQTAYVAKLEASIDSEITYSVIAPDEFTYRRQIKDRFITLMLTSKLAVKVDRHSILDKVLD